MDVSAQLLGFGAGCQSLLESRVDLKEDFAKP